MGETILVRGRWVVVDARQPVMTDAALRLENERVAEVDGWQSLRSRYPDAPVLGGEDSAVIPGLINAHHHSHAVSSLAQGVGDDLLEPWILAWHALRPVDPGLNTLVSAGVQLGAGVTGVVDMLSAGGSAEQFAGNVADALQAYERAGLRAAFAPGVASRSHLVAGDGEDRRFIESLPEGDRAAAESLLPDASRLDEADYFAVMQDLQQRYAGHPRVGLWYGPPGPQWVSDECLQRCAEEAERWDCGIQTHVNESLYEKLHGANFYGMPTVLHLQRLGVLGPRFTMAHGTWLNRDEIEAIATSGAAVSHNPSSNLRLRAGIAPFAEFLRQGVTTGIGMDATTLNEDEDMFAEIRLALRLQAEPLIERDVPTPADALHAATRGGAKLMGQAARLGSLQAGFAADLVILDCARICWPWIAPEVDPLELILLRAQRRDIRQVLVAGEILWENGAPTRFDLDAAGAELATKLAEKRFPQSRRRAVEAIMPHLKAWYAAWDKPALEAWTQRSSRI